MTLSARDVAAELRRQIPGLGTKKLHKLLYKCQCHHLAHFGVPLFKETISAWDMGPVCSSLWYAERNSDPTAEIPLFSTEMNEGQLNTIGYVVSRYSALTGKDLEVLTHAEPPWQMANARRGPGVRSVRIEDDWMRDYQRTADAEEDDGAAVTSAAISAWLAGAEQRRDEPRRPDSIESLQARLVDAQARAARG